MSAVDDTAPTFTWDDVQRQIDATAERVRQEMQDQHSQEMESLRKQVAGTGVQTLIPEHAAGPGTDVADTWSLAEQTASRAAAEAKLAGK